MLQECYAKFDAATGRLVIGNGCAEKTVEVRGSFFRTAQVTDKKNSKVWGGEAALWQRCPVLGENETPGAVFSVEEKTDVVGKAPHLLAVLELTGTAGKMWLELAVFPGIPFVYSQVFAEKTGEVALAAQAENEVQPTGVENSYKLESANAVFCSEDTLDCVPLGNSHLELEIFTLYDKTDRNDSLLERQTVPVYRRGKAEKEGNIFRIGDYAGGCDLLLVKHSPTPSSALHRHNKDLVLQGNGYALLQGNGVDFAAMPAGRVPYYASAVGVAAAKDTMEELWRYNTAMATGGVHNALFVMSNTWGDRSQDMSVCESFLLQEIERAHELGVDIVQIDDGWESGITANSKRKAGGVWEGYYSDSNDFWVVNEERFPNGLEPVVQKAKAYGMEIGLWFSPDSSNDFANVEKDIETLWRLYKTHGVRFFKMDGVKIRSKLGEMRFIHLMKTLTERSGGEITFNLDVTAEDRFGYLYETQYGTLFVENRYTDWGNYFPHNTFKNLWGLAAVVPTRRLQMELLNLRRNAAQYEGCDFAPDGYGMDYVFASVLPANPLVWMEVSHLPEEDAAALGKISAIYRQYKEELFTARVIPVGEMPNGMHFSGYVCKNADGTSGHVLLFREETAESGHDFDLPVNLQGARIEKLYESAPTVTAETESGLWAAFSAQRAVVWLRYSRQ